MWHLACMQILLHMQIYKEWLLLLWLENGFCILALKIHIFIDKGKVHEKWQITTNPVVT